MKVGDKGWVYFNMPQEIAECEIVRDLDMGWDVKTKFRDRPYYFLKREVFPTREALCAHYRKIFE